MKFFALINKIQKRFNSYNPMIGVLISEKALKHNLNQYKRQHPGLKFCPVLKSNAYGHGLLEVATILDDQDCPFFVLDSLHEAIDLRANDIKTPILIVGYVPPESIQKHQVNDVAFTITSLDQLKTVSKIIDRDLNIHLKVDTGMHRQGILPEEIEQALNIIHSNDNLHLDGVCSHLADADGDTKDFTKKQLETWKKCIDQIILSHGPTKYFHISASAGSFYEKETFGNVARLGLGLYGINPSPYDKNLQLKPALSMYSIISSIRQLPAGETIGYNATYKLTTTSTIATVPTGYYEGVDRRLSSAGVFRVDENECPIVGRVSMNITSIDVSKVKKVQNGDKVEVVSADPQAKNSVQSIAGICKTIPWEILVHIPSHLRRTIVK